MKALTHEDILPLDAYEQVRAVYRPALMAHKERRRLAVGPRVSLCFEDRETVRYQIQEMARVEGTRGRDKIQVELDVYNELVPGAGELTATLFIEIPQLDQIKAELMRLVGIDEHVHLVLGEDSDEERVRADFDTKQMEEDRLSAVQYIRFRLSDGQVARFLEGAPLRVAIDHPNYGHEAVVLRETRESLARDLRDEPPGLLDPAEIPASAPAVELLHESETLRVTRWRDEPAAGRVVVERLGDPKPLSELAPDAVAELLTQVQASARLLTREFGACRVQVDVQPGGGTRVLVIPPLR